MISRSKLSSTVAALLLLLTGARIGMAQDATRAAAANRPVVLFDGKSLNGWKPIETPQMALLPDGSVANQRGKGLLLYAERPFKDFTLELEYLPETATAVAGVFLRLQLVRGEIDRERYLSGMASLLTAIRDNPKLAPVAAALNEERLMLREAGSPPAPAPSVAAPPPVTQEGNQHE